MRTVERQELGNLVNTVQLGSRGTPRFNLRTSQLEFNNYRTILRESGHNMDQGGTDLN